MIRPVLSQLWRHHRLTLIAFVAATGLAVFFALRLTLSTIYWSDPDHFRQEPERWMTPGYIARSWNLSPEQVVEALGLAPGALPRKRTLDDIARERGVPVETLIADLQVFLDARQP